MNKGKKIAFVISSKIPLERAIELGKQKVLSRIRIDEKGCWIWTGHKMSEGYGETSYRNKPWRVHRLSYTLWKGEFDPLLDICHTCDNKACCNPEHLWVGTHRENMIDHVKKGKHYELKKDTCDRGHPFSAENTDWHSNGPGRNLSRVCKACHRGRQRIKAGWSPEEAFSLAPIPPAERSKRRTYSHTKRKRAA